MARKATVIIDKELCKGCELCVIACPVEGLVLSDDLNLKGYRIVRLDTDKCTGCVNCALVCPDSAISVFREPKAAKSEAT
jgi:2-oxoglutarate ferredoxin oxidoreductase subunit delta